MASSSHTRWILVPHHHIEVTATMGVKSYIKHLYIFYGILVNIFYFGTHHTGGGEARDGKGFFKKPVILRERWVGSICRLIFSLFYFFYFESLNMFYNFFKLWYSLQRLVNCCLNRYIRSLIGRPDRLNKINIVFKIMPFLAEALSLLFK